MLPRIKYRNPSVSIEINRHSDPNGPAKLHIYTKSSSPSTTPSESTAAAATQTPAHSVDIRMTHHSEILAQLVSRTNATELQPTEQELLELEEMKEFKAKSEADRTLVREKLNKERREQELLRLARGEVNAAA
jgi:large subunit ribosomal protein MRP49